MSPDAVISVEGLGKSYLLGHTENPANRNGGFGDSVAQNVKATLRKTADMLRGRAIIAGDRVEEFWALKDVSFGVRAGDRLGIIGRNGAGKSTLLKLLSRITEPSEGRALIHGRVVSLLEVGTGFHPELTGRENIYLNGSILGMSRREIHRKVDDIISFAEIERFVDTPVKRYSSGMYVRLAFSVAAHIEPEILIVDEVLAVGDSRFQKKCLGKIGQMGESGRTVLFVSHHLGVINSLCNRCLLLEGGRLTMDGAPADVIERYMDGQSESKGQISFAPKKDQACSITRVAITSKPGAEAIDNIDFQAPFSVEVDIHAHDPLDAIIGVGILDSSGDVLTTFHSVEIGKDELSSPHTHLNRGINRFSVSIPNNVLRPGTYHVSSSVFSRRLHQTFDYRETVLSFVVSDHGNRNYFDSRQQGRIIFSDLVWDRH